MAIVSVKIVHAGCAHVVGLIRVWLWIFDGFLRYYRDGKNGYAVRLQNPTDFRDRLFVIGDVFQHMRSKDEIISFVGEWKLLEINVVIDATP